MRRVVFRLLALVAGSMVFGCAASQSQELERTREIFLIADSDPTITQRASATLHEARQSLNRAEKSASLKEQRHMAYLALRQIELARLQARQQEKQHEVQTLQEQQDRHVHSLRRLQAEHARRMAEQAQRDLQSYLSDEKQETDPAGN